MQIILTHKEALNSVAVSTRLFQKLLDEGVLTQATYTKLTSDPDAPGKTSFDMVLSKLAHASKMPDGEKEILESHPDGTMVYLTNTAMVMDVPEDVMVAVLSILTNHMDTLAKAIGFFVAGAKLFAKTAKKIKGEFLAVLNRNPE